jgi:hypothetical protein
MRFDIAERAPYRDFDLPVVHLPEFIEGHYAPDGPFMTGDEARAEGEAYVTWKPQVAKEQLLGTRIAANTLRLLEEPESIAFSARLIAASGLNAAWYSFARYSEDVQRRRLKLPVLDNDNPDWRPTSGELHQTAVDNLEFAQWPAFKIVKAHEVGKANLVEFNPEYGRTIGNIALTLAAIDVGDKVHGNTRVSNFLTQHLVRERGKSALRDSRVLIKEVKSFPSIAQLANPNSDLATFMRHNGPRNSRDAFSLSLEEGIAYGPIAPEFMQPV